jgi:hypothetical protein
MSIDAAVPTASHVPSRLRDTLSRNDHERTGEEPALPGERHHMALRAAWLVGSGRLWDRAVADALGAGVPMPAVVACASGHADAGAGVGTAPLAAVEQLASAGRLRQATRQALGPARAAQARRAIAQARSALRQLPHAPASPAASRRADSTAPAGAGWLARCLIAHAHAVEQGAPPADERAEAGAEVIAG